MIELFLLEQLLAVYENKTLYNAAKSLHLTQPTLSRNMQKLENEIGIPLFERTRNRITLNENGLLAVKYAKQILAKEKEMKEQIQKNAKYSIGFDAPGPRMLIKHVFKKNNLTFLNTDQLHNNQELLDGLLQGKYDMIVTNHNYEDMNIHSQFFCAENLFLYVPKEHPISRFSSVSAKQMDGTNFLMAENIGLWMELVQQNMPNSKFLLQDSVDALSQIVIYSSIPSFATNITLALSHKNEFRTAIPFSDDAFHVRFYLSFCKDKKELLNHILSILSNTKNISPDNVH